MAGVDLRPLRDTRPRVPSRSKHGLVVAVGAAVALLVATAWLLSEPERRGPASAPSASASSHGGQPTVAPTPGASQGLGTPTAAPSIAVPARLAGVDWTVIPTTRRVVALTFDDGDGPGLVSILATLAAQRVNATFFPTGEFAEARPDAIRAMVAGGHRLGNHSATHPYFTTIPDDQIILELSTAESKIRAAGGATTRPLFRFPYGERTAHTINVVNRAGYVPVRWSIDTNGWQGFVGGVTVDSIVDTVITGARPGAIVLMHPARNTTDGTTLDADALPRVISELRGRGYDFVTLDTLLR
jgi:peptidoglycan/xylan/chitin deacetylase (PgdA/CDA1 family)